MPETREGNKMKIKTNHHAGVTNIRSRMKTHEQSRWLESNSGCAGREVSMIEI